MLREDHLTLYYLKKRRFETHWYSIYSNFLQSTFTEKLIVSRQICQALVFIHSAVPLLARSETEKCFGSIFLITLYHCNVEEGTLCTYLADFGLGKF